MRDCEHKPADFRYIVDEPREKLSALSVVVKGIAHPQQVAEQFFAHGEFDSCAHAAPHDFDLVVEEIICRVNRQECARRQNHLRRYAER